ncbi:MAG: hypothetical protein ABIJ04_12630 [Bacteroidota bacterium]
MKRLFIVLTLCLFLTPAALHAQEVRNVTSEVKEGMIRVHYALAGKFYQTFTVSLYVSRDGGNTFNGPLKEVTGDIGSDIRKGNHTITWDVIREMPMVEETLVFDIRAEITGEKPKSSFFIQYVANPTTYMGLRAGMLGIVGFYGEVRGNLKALESAKYSYKDGIVEFNQAGYFVFSEKNGYSAFSALAGITYQPARNFFLYLGAGYGKEDYLLGMDEYSYEGDVKTGSSNARYDGYCTSGVEVDLGLMLRFKWFLLSAGGTALNFKSFNFTAGVGAAF